jgi:hypothetical protein
LENPRKHANNVCGTEDGNRIRPSGHGHHEAQDGKCTIEEVSRYDVANNSFLEQMDDGSESGWVEKM